MTVLRYCERVKLLLDDVDVCPDQQLLHRLDRVKASCAVTRALEGDDVAALELAERIAKRWMLDP